MSQAKIPVWAKGTAALEQILRRHPSIELSGFENGEVQQIEFEQSGRRVAQYGVPQELYGTVELMDNNPLVCARTASCTGAAATLVATALVPLIRSQVLLERPACIFSFDTSFDECESLLLHESWNDGASFACDPQQQLGCLSASFLCLVRLGSETVATELFDEFFARSFYVRKNNSTAWNASLVEGKPHLLYNLNMTDSIEESNVLRIDLIGDSRGKLGAAHLVHLFNVMACFEEDLGIGDDLPSGTS